MFEVQLIPILYRLVVNEEDSRSKPLASAHIFIDGPRGHVTAVIGKSFIENHEMIINKCREIGLKTLQGPMIPEVAYAFKQAVGDRLTITHDELLENGVKVEYVIVNIE